MEEKPHKNLRHRERKEFDLEEWIEEHEVPIKREGGWNRGGRKWILA